MTHRRALGRPGYATLSHFLPARIRRPFVAAEGRRPGTVFGIRRFLSSRVWFALDRSLSTVRGIFGGFFWGFRVFWSVSESFGLMRVCYFGTWDIRDILYGIFVGLILIKVGLCYSSSINREPISGQTGTVPQTLSHVGFKLERSNIIASQLHHSLIWFPTVLLEFRSNFQHQLFEW